MKSLVRVRYCASQLHFFIYPELYRFKSAYREDTEFTHKLIDIYELTSLITSQKLLDVVLRVGDNQLVSEINNFRRNSMIANRLYDHNSDIYTEYRTVLCEIILDGDMQNLERLLCDKKIKLNLESIRDTYSDLTMTPLELILLCLYQREINTDIAEKMLTLLVAKCAVMAIHSKFKQIEPNGRFKTLMRFYSFEYGSFKNLDSEFREFIALCAVRNEPD